MRSTAVSLLLASLVPLAGAQVTTYDNFVAYDNAVGGTHTLFLDFETDKFGAPVDASAENSDGDIHNDIGGDRFSFDVVYSSPDYPSSRANIAEIGQGIDNEIGPFNAWDGTLRWEYGRRQIATAFTGIDIGGSTMLRLFEGNTLVGAVELGPSSLFQFFGFVSANPFDRAELDGDFYAIDAHYSTAECIVLDFESEDDFSTVLVNGQHINTEFGALVSITSAGSNAGAAIFDSTINGPNDPSQDLDLLVDTGNILILQTENFPPDGNDLFPRPNDDNDGGTLSFSFLSESEAVSVRLIDLDSSDADSSVVLTDSAALQRTYVVPSNWTGDLTAAEPGQATLDLAVLSPQAGFASLATAAEDAGFDPLAVVRIDFNLGGSGAIDDLCFRTSRPRASAIVRNGSGVNPSTLSLSSLPVLGRTLAANLDCTAQGPGLAVLEVRRYSTSGTMTIPGEVLVSGPLVYRTILAHPGSVSLLTWDVPFDMALLGLNVHAQGLCSATASPLGPRLSHFRSRLSNAMDLVLGL